jgi:hypothetical protein
VIGVRVCDFEDESGSPHVKHHQGSIVVGESKETWKFMSHDLEQGQ